MKLIKIVFIANVIVASIVGITSLFAMDFAQKHVFQGVFQMNGAMQLVGALWTAIAVLSLMGIFHPVKFSPVLLLQLVYKSSWLIVYVIPSLIQGKEVPIGVTIFFVFWVCVLPFAIPWKHLTKPLH